MSSVSVLLPVELWLYIFRLSTISSETRKLHATTYRPFDTTKVDAVDVAVTRTKAALVRVCKQWRAWAMELLYEDLLLRSPKKLPQVSLHDVAAREAAASNPCVEPAHCGRWVRRACLPYCCSSTPSYRPPKALQILEQCPRLEVLVRTGPFSHPDADMRFEFSTSCPPLPALKRLDWWHDNEAARAGGINLLGDVLLAAPNLQYLSVGGRVHFSHVAPRPPDLPKLATLRVLQGTSVQLVGQLSRWSLPSLRHLVLDGAEPNILEFLWEAFGAQLRTIELGESLCFAAPDARTLARILESCPQLEELNYHVFMTAVPAPFREEEKFDTITTVGLHAQPSSLVPQGSTEFWQQIQGHFDMLYRPNLSALRKIVLYDDWDMVANDCRYLSLIQPLLDRRVTIERASD
ncbi:hypothetical protein WOLCODRAFT_135893 [Wolfiporia cocos MD-104 SS10]|uniref:F-box domain-containing protein n=1 Tax=Wolfiporia cocos (strain MD-104) TaxID=742152 RepID=A0A2H3JMK6_WOLCO|nr:hypothetical protein WOLCODRAFT_135893 [Wolfiporia cocos MD-104 SS10]